jgi:hypothetical protein
VFLAADMPSLHTLLKRRQHAKSENNAQEERNALYSIYSIYIQAGNTDDALQALKDAQECGGY